MVVIELVFLIGLSLALSALNVHFRDVQHILGNVMTLWFFLCPILYPASNIPEAFRATLFLNPVALFTEMYQGIFLEGAVPSLMSISATTLVALAVLYAGNMIFSYYRDSFAELI